MTTPVASSPLEDRVSALATGGERETLEAFLDYYRDAICRKLAGVSDDDARRRTLPSATCLGGLVKHLRWVEMGWFQRTLARRPPESLPPKIWTQTDPDADMRMEDDETLSELIDEYVQECERSREVAAGMALDAAAPQGRLGQVSLRWVYVHMIEETARHAGHLDILREQLDGVVGD